LVLDPQNPFFRWQLAMSFAGAGRNDEAISELQKMLAADPNSSMAHDALSDVFYLERREAEAIREAKESFVLRGRETVADALSRGYQEAGYRGAMEEAASVVAAERGRTYVGAITLARFYAHAGLTDPALEWLENAVVERDTRMVYVVGDPVYETIRHDPRFQDLLRRAQASAKTQ
jgi:tetratricopeptide (TPR) repeat protein